VTVDGISPGRIVSPESLDELSGLIASEKGAIVPVGAGTQLEFGNPLQSADCIVSLARLNRITTYNPAELTIHVEAGVTLDQIQQDTGTYYVIAYSPTNAAYDGKYRAISVKVSRPGAKVRARRGYLSVAPPQLLVPRRP